MNKSYKISRRILGIDPGLAESGWGMVENSGNRLKLLGYGTIVTSAGTEHTSRLLAIHDEILRVIKEFNPDIAAIEKLYFAKNAKTAMPVGEARGVLCLALAQSALPVFEYAPNQIKMAITGVGGAEKKQIQEMVRLILGLDDIPRPDHAADALGAAICCAQNNN